MSELVTIEGTLRTTCGKSHARKVRRDGKIPANLVSKDGNTLLSLDPKWLGRAYKSAEKKFNLVVDGKTTVVTIKEVQIDNVKRLPLHVDLMKA